ncbi:MAG: amidase family protein [Clostridia bacterium]|nr:amidase family protein [Clostridia bacterium]
MEKYFSEVCDKKKEGINIALQDNINIKDLSLTCSSKILENFISPYDASIVEKINEQGMNIVRKIKNG